jgi:hypothetical protein
MSIRWYSTVVDCGDVRAQAHWWAEVLGWTVAYESDDGITLLPPHALTKADQIPVEERGPCIEFVPVPEGKTVKNRLHIDLAPRAGEDQQAEVDRVIALGARHADVGQPADATFVVLRDPEENEFCILSARD